MERPSAIMYLLPCLAAVCLYAITLHFDLTFDDKAHMEPPGVEETRTWRQVWGEPSLFYRPVVTATFWLETRHGVPLAVRHGVNVFLHALVTLLVVRLAVSLGIPGWIAAASGFLFAVHPVHVEAVAGLVGRADLMAVTWMLVALLVHERAVRRDGNRYRAALWILGLSFLAAGSKEYAWGLPAFAAVLHLAWRRSPAPAWPLFVGYAAGILGHLVLRGHVLGSWLASPRGEIPAIDNPLVNLEGLERLAGGLVVGGLNLAHLVFPVTLAPDYSGRQIDVTGSIGDLRFWGGVLLVLGPAAAVAAGILRGRSGRPLVVGGGWILISAFMVMNLVYTIETVLADRLLYWPSVAWVLIVGGLAACLVRSAGGHAARAGPRGRELLAGGLLLLVAAGYTVRAARYLPVWENDKTLFEAAVKITPRVPRVWYNLGFALHREGNLEEAVEAYRKARNLEPTTLDAWAHEAAALMQLGRWEEARAPLREALRLNPRDVISLVNSGIYWLHVKDPGRAAERFEAALREDPSRTEAWFNLGIARQRLGENAGAEAAFRRCLEFDPADAEAMDGLAGALFAQGKVRAAAALARKAELIKSSSEHRERK